MRPIGLDMVEVGGSNPLGPTKLLRRCFYSTLFFQNRAFWRVSVRGHYRRKVVIGQLSLQKYRLASALPSRGTEHDLTSGRLKTQTPVPLPSPSSRRLPGYRQHKKDAAQCCRPPLSPPD